MNRIQGGTAAAPEPTVPARCQRFWGAACAILLTVFLVVCSDGQKQAQTVAQTQAQIPADWKTQHDPMGFSIAIPSDWSTRGDPATGRVELSAPGSANAVIWPVFLENSRLDPVSASAVAQRLTAKLWPNVVWSGAVPVGRNAVRLAGRRGDAVVVAAFTWAESPKGTAGNFYAATAPAAHYAEIADRFSKVLGSFHAVGTPAAGAQTPSQPEVRYVKWMDPRENAFIVDVPEGWRVAGGMFRAASNDTRVGVTVDSPDGQMSLQLGDPNLPVFAEPSQMMNATGFSEGRWYSPVPGVSYLVRRYLPATYFLNEYVRTKMASVCQQLQLEQPHDRSDSLRAINALMAQLGAYGTFMQSTGAEIGFSCERNGQPYRGYFFAITQLTRTQGMEGGTWSVTTQVGCLAPASRADEAMALAAHLLRSMEMNPQWLAMQQNITANTSKIISQANGEVSDIISSGYEGRRKIQDETARRQTNVNRGQEDVVDTANGEHLKIKSGANYNWMDYRGNIVGTDTATAPSADFHELMRQP